MFQVLIDYMLPSDADPKNPAVRQRCGAVAGGIGIGLNLVLCTAKFLAGLFTGSIAVIADAVNNLADAATSVVTLVGFRLAGQSADVEHPFGHGRMEYLTGLVVSLAILLMGFEIGQNAVEKLFNPQPLLFSWGSIAILAASILVKLWMFGFNRTLGRRIDSAAMDATATDSLSDAVSTAVVLSAALADHFLHLHIDAFAGLLVAAFVLKSGWDAVKDTMDPLLGRPMDSELAADIDRIVLSHPNIIGIHDLIYHDYGPGRAMMSFHAEVPANGDLMELHDLIDHIERELKGEHHIDTVIHMDPVVRDESTDTLRQQILHLVHGIHPRCSIHDFRITPGPMHTNILFDVVVPHGFPMSDEQVREQLTQEIKGLSSRYFPIIDVDHSFITSTQ